MFPASMSCRRGVKDAPCLSQFITASHHTPHHIRNATTIARTVTVKCTGWGSNVITCMRHTHVLADKVLLLTVEHIEDESLICIRKLNIAVLGFVRQIHVRLHECEGRSTSTIMEENQNKTKRSKTTTINSSSSRRPTWNVSKDIPGFLVTHLR